MWSIKITPYKPVCRNAQPPQYPKLCITPLKMVITQKTGYWIDRKTYIQLIIAQI
jgi:hypothetical protein